MALAATVTVAETVAPLVGWVSVTVGLVVPVAGGLSKAPTYERRGAGGSTSRR